jgi:hypothetical protein
MQWQSEFMNEEELSLPAHHRPQGSLVSSNPARESYRTFNKRIVPNSVFAILHCLLSNDVSLISMHWYRVAMISFEHVRIECSCFWSLNFLAYSLRYYGVSKRNEACASHRQNSVPIDRSYRQGCCHHSGVCCSLECGFCGSHCFSSSWQSSFREHPFHGSVLGFGPVVHQSWGLLNEWL